ncbi:MAG TPA: stage V sporulation protein AA [Candidatus Fimimorpha faecalis]|uniref:Stage V sporulation protein AA n=1 Tax=Candidatus Fimimorpha faecalis TaxID=2840824 RepID=A0A9D1ED59_9FIRM|nr:stage V sporulation protein AA [Candidatus Fimimorpha faecalis]
MTETLYIKLEQNITVNEPMIVIGHIAQMWCKDKDVLSRCMALKLTNIPTQKGRYLYSVFDVVQLIQQNYPDVEVENLGETDFIVEYGLNQKGNKIWEWVRTLFISIIIFFGAAFAIMTFNNDVGVSDVFQKIYHLVTGAESNGFTAIEIGYSIGLPLGILVFYNHFSKKKVTSDPTPLEVEMRLYEQDLNTAIIKDAERRTGKGDEYRCG